MRQNKTHLVTARGKIYSTDRHWIRAARVKSKVRKMKVNTIKAPLSSLTTFFISHFIILFFSTPENNIQLSGQHWLCLDSWLITKHVTNPVDVLIYACSATNATSYTRKSALCSGSCPCGPSGSQGLVASSWQLGQLGASTTRTTTTLSPSSTVQSIQGVFHLKPSGNLSKFPIIIPVIVSYLDTKQECLSNPWLSVRASFSNGVVWL